MIAARSGRASLDGGGVVTTGGNGVGSRKHPIAWSLAEHKSGFLKGLHWRQGSEPKMEDLEVGTTHYWKEVACESMNSKVCISTSEPVNRAKLSLRRHGDALCICFLGVLWGAFLGAQYLSESLWRLWVWGRILLTQTSCTSLSNIFSYHWKAHL